MIYDAKGRRVKDTKPNEVGDGQVFILGDESTNDSIAIRIVNDVAHFQLRQNGVWQDTSLITSI